MGAYMNFGPTSKIAIKIYSQRREDLRRRNLKKKDIVTDFKIEIDN